MMGLTFATVLHASIVVSGAATYSDAFREARNGKPIVVLVSTEWCPPCQQMKKTVLPEVRRRGLLRKVAFAIVNPDRQRKLARKLTGGNPAIPQLIMYRRTAKGWRCRRLVGGQSAKSVEKFINQGIALDKAAKKSGAGQKPRGIREREAVEGAGEPKDQPVKIR